MKNPLKSATGARTGALIMTTGSLVWTAYGIHDLLGGKGIPVVIAVESLYLTLHYAEIRGVGGPKARKAIWILGWIAAVALGAFLCVHAATEWGAMAAAPAAVPPLASKLLWWVDEQLIRRDSLEPTPEMKAEHALKVRESDHEARMAEAEIKAEAAKEVARLKALGEVAMTRTEVMFQVNLDRLNKEDEMRIREPLSLPPAVHEFPVSTSRELVPTGQATSQVFGFASALDPNAAPTARAERVQEIRESYALGNGFSPSEIRERYGVGKSVAYELLKEAKK